MSASGSVSHTFFTAGQISDNCSLDANRAECRSYVMGIADAMGGNVLYGWHACIPLDSTGEAVLAVAMDYLRRHPEERAGSSASVIAKALSQAFPCQ
jgi:Ssp1 endopeptidase immunity protein Rap1a